MNRNEEYRRLKDELADMPPELQYTFSRAQARLQQDTRRRWLRIPAISLASLFLVFVVLVNTMTSFALAVGRLPLIGELARAVAFSPSLTAALKNDYVQLIGQAQTKDGLSVQIDYVIVDQKQLNIFYTIRAQDDGDYWIEPSLRNPDGSAMEGHSSISNLSIGSDQSVRQFSIDYTEGQVPEQFRLRCDIHRNPPPSDPIETDEWSPFETPERPPAVARFEFDITIDTGLTAEPEIIPLNKAVALDGQTITIKQVEIYPTHVRLELIDDEANTAWLRAIDFYLIDQTGRHFGKIKQGITASGTTQTDSYFMPSHRIESPYFSDARELTLFIRQVTWLDKAATKARIDLINRTGQNLPQGVKVHQAIRSDQGWEVSFSAPIREINHSYQLFLSTYYDAAGQPYEYNTSSTSWYGEDLADNAFVTTIWLRDYFEDIVYLTLHFPRVVEFNQPVVVKLK